MMNCFILAISLPYLHGRKVNAATILKNTPLTLLSIYLIVGYLSFD